MKKYQIGDLKINERRKSMEVIMLLIGIFSGSLITSIIFVIKSSSGTLKIDHSNPQKDVYRFEIKDLDRLNKKKYVRLKIDNNADLSQI